ncbi:MAG: hypothetical protein AW10_04222 [Candidatus Accumulibacter appositus]|uniref:Uncharacterized protein n=1 Tax=Candidatus Accumulibacter appositus TaxID=1454003 RepID=A0A011PDK3_9PROT|nr:MAG: hypothetical protein AW10_04222 [Candidatus Accumulibacter appositus]
MVQIVVDLHVAQRGKTIEPGVGHRLDGVRKAVLVDALNQAIALLMHLAGPCLPGDDDDVALLLAGGDVELAAFHR